jgi:ribosome-associated heat shock protein Hsp15
VAINDTRVKPAHPVRTGDTVRARTPGGERIVVVREVVTRRTGAAIAVLNYEDRTPPAPPKEERPAPVLRERGAGRPTKRDRRRLDRLTGRS